MKDSLRCIHRHTIKTHPKCFEKGAIKWPDVKTFEKFSGEPWYKYPGYKIGYFDIETDNLNADFGTVLTWCIKDKDGEIYYDVIKKEEMFNGYGDKRIVESFINKLQEYSIIIGYYSSMFDLPFMRSKSLYYNIDFPHYSSIYHWDLYYTVRNKLHLSRNSLDNVCNYLGIDGKTHIDKNIWRLAKYGDNEALDYVLEHNKYDVIITEQLHNRLEFSRKWIRSSI